MTPQLSDDLLARLSAFATDAYGLRFPPDRWSELARGVASAALELGIPDLEGWAESLVAGNRTSEHLAAVANHLTISETYFFRQPDTFVQLEKEILPPRIMERQRTRQKLRIWSAGCASGEEPYSIAILLRQRFPDLRPETISIVGTDINSHVLARAEKAVYSEWSFRDAPEWLKPRYFRANGRGRYELLPEIRHLVRFAPLNLASPLYPAEFGERGDFDVILCRNVLMYFSAEWQDRIIRRFTAALATGGWLLVGPCDVTSEEATELRLQSSHPGIFQKVESLGAPKLYGAAPGNLAELPLASVALEPTPPAALPVEPTPAAAAPAPLPPPPAPVAAEPLDAVARGHADRGELEEALTACDQALAANNMDANVHHLRACVLMELNRTSEAEAGFRRVLYLDPESVMAQFALASLAQRSGREEEARHHFRQVLRTLTKHQRTEPIPNGDGMTVGRLKELVERTLEDHAA